MELLQTVPQAIALSCVRCKKRYVFLQAETKNQKQNHRRSSLKPAGFMFCGQPGSKLSGLPDCSLLVCTLFVKNISKNFLIKKFLNTIDKSKEILHTVFIG